MAAQHGECFVEGEAAQVALKWREVVTEHCAQVGCVLRQRLQRVGVTLVKLPVELQPQRMEVVGDEGVWRSDVKEEAASRRRGTPAEQSARVPDPARSQQATQRNATQRKRET